MSDIKVTPLTVSKPMKVSKLKAVDPKAAEPSKPKILIFGREGVGKTWASMDFPSCYYIDSEGGANRDHYTDKLKKSGGMYFGPEQGSQSFEEVTEQIKALATEDHNFKTVVIDSASKLMSIEVGRETDRLMDEKKKIEFSVEKKPAARLARRLNSWIDRIDMNVVIISHEKPLWAKGEQIGVTYDAWDKVGYDLDLVLNIQKTAARRFAKVTKSRLIGFAEESMFDWDYSEFASRYGKEVIERKSEKIQLANEDQVKEILRLIDLVKLPEDWDDKTLTKAKATTWSELNEDQATKTIAFLKGKLA